MLQKLTTVPALGTVLILSTVGLLVEKPSLGVSASKPTVIASNISDPSSSTLFAYEKAATPQNEQMKLASAVEAISEVSTEPLPTPEARVASQTMDKDGEVFVDTINHTLPPVFDGIATPKPIPTDIEALIRKYALEYGANAEIMIGIARCESGMNPGAVSPSGAYKGLYQFVASTWQSNREAMGLPSDQALMLNAEEAVKTAAFKMARDGYGAWPVCSQQAMNSLALN